MEAMEISNKVEHLDVTVPTTEESSKMSPTNEHNLSGEDILGTDTLCLSYSDDGSDGEDTTEKDAVDLNKEQNSVPNSTESNDNEKGAVIGEDENKDIPMPMEVDEDTENIAGNSMRKFNRIIDSDEDTDEEEKTRKNVVAVEKADTSKKGKISRLCDSDSETERKSDSDSNQLVGSKKPQKAKMSALVDSESESEHEEHIISEPEPEPEPEPETETATPKSEMTKTKSKPKVRASAKKALDEIQAIQSEQQRLHREQNISIPYHKPKKHTLQEFLKRRTIIRPDAQAESCPVAAVVKSRNLKMTPEELEEYAKLMEERAKEASDFFKSEDEEEELKPNPGVSLDEGEQIQIEEVTTNQTDAMDEDHEVPTEVPQQETSANDVDVLVRATNLIEDDQCPEVQPVGESSVDNPDLASKVVITEVIRLPTLDMNDFIPQSSNEENKENGTQSPGVTGNINSIKRFIKEKNLPDTPTLKGDPNMLINLETGDLIKKQPTGVDNLLSRLMSTNKQTKPHSPKTINILSTENGRLEVSNVKLHPPDDLEAQNHKPGAAYVELKQRLRDLITQKRREGLQKKLEQESEYNKLEDLEDSEESDLEHTSCMANITIDDEENIENRDDNVVNNRDCESGTETEEGKSDLDDLFGNSDNVDDNRDPSHSDSNQNLMVEDSNAGEQNSNGPRKSRIVKAFLDDSDDETDSQPIASGNVVKAVPLFQPEPQRSHSDEENELLGLCSGTFSSTAQNSQMPIISQIPVTQMTSDVDPSEELLGLCSGTFEACSATNTQPELGGGLRKIVSSEDEDEDEMEHSDGESIGKKRNKKLTKKVNTKRTNLKFSDDEDEADEDDSVIKDKEIDSPAAEDAKPNENQEENEDEEEDEDDGEQGGEGAEDELPQTFIDYDSEENEVVVEMTKKDCLKHAMNFVEQEAELSESEWGSADEDEKNMDDYDIELGDEDEFDREKIQMELGQIHARKMLDDDIKKVRQIQELLFEDEETDGVGRQRQFKWKNAETGFSLDDGERAEDAGSGGESGDDENEQMWRKIRFEREQLIREEGLTEDKTVATTLSSSASPAPVAATKKINIITAKKSTTLTEIKQSSPFLISKETSVMHTKTSRGSFLGRDKETLIKLAELTRKEVDFNNIIDTAGPVSVKVKKSKNFVFTTLSESEHEMQKRKAEDLLNSSNECGKNFMKRPKTEAYKDECLIDHLH